MTLYHWDLPAALDDRGGWAESRHGAAGSPTTPRVLFRALGDRVTRWMTINEPWVVVDAGSSERRARSGTSRASPRRPASPTICCSPSGQAVQRMPGRDGGSDRPGGEPGAQVSRLGLRGGSGRHRARRRLHEPAVSGSGLARAVPGRDGGDLRGQPGPSFPRTTSARSGSPWTSSA